MRNDDSNQTFVTHIASPIERRFRVYGVKVYRTSNVLTERDSFRFQTRPACPPSLWRKEFGPSKVPAERPFARRQTECCVSKGRGSKTSK